MRRAYERTIGRGVAPAIYTRELFATNRAAVALVPAGGLDLVGIALRAELKKVDKIVDPLRSHP